MIVILVEGLETAFILIRELAKTRLMPIGLSNDDDADFLEKKVH